MKRLRSYIRRNPFTVPFVVAGVAVAAILFFRGEANRSHGDKGLTALCQKIEKQSKIDCEKKKAQPPSPKGVAVSNGNQSPSGQPGPAGDGGAPGTDHGGGEEVQTPTTPTTPTPPGQTPKPGNNVIGDTVNNVTGAGSDVLHDTGCIVNGLLSQSC